MSKKLSYLFSRPTGVERKNYRKYIVVLITCITGFLGHIGFGTLFWIFDIDFLCTLNLVSAIVWAFATVLNYRGYHAQLAEHIDTLYIVNTVVAGVPLILGMFSIRQINENQERILTDLATTDELTGLYNRRYGNNYLKKHHQAIDTGGFKGCVVIGDIDHFKGINDKHGHDVGDRVLRVISSRLGRSFRESDVICRWGGEEFLIILDQANPDKARRIVDRIRQELSRSIEINESLLLTVTMSFGIASTLESQSPKGLIKLADENLYRAKNNGRNCVYSKSLIEDGDKVISLGRSSSGQKSP